MVSLPVEPPFRRTTGEVLAALDGNSASVAAGVSVGTYAFWLGSGISRDVVPCTAELVRKVLDYLQQRIIQGDPRCRFRLALLKVLDVATLSANESAAIDLDQPVEGWPNLDGLLDRLASKYSQVLEVSIGGDEEEDVLLWDAIDVRETYAGDSLEPDAEHLCIAILILEGVIPVIASANWDGLIEESVRRLNGQLSPVLRVLVHQNEYRLPDARCDLIKFHGCAVKAKSDPATYRKLLIARKSQVARWAQNPDYAVAVGRLTNLVATRPTLMIGLSAQDANIQEVFSRAEVTLRWEWPSDPTAIVFAEEQIGADQNVILALVYGDNYHQNLSDIEVSARLGCYAKPLLLALVLYTLEAKLCALIGSIRSSNLGANDVAELQDGIRTIRDEISGEASVDILPFMFKLIQTMSLILKIFRTGVPPTPGSLLYEPLTSQPIDLAQADPNVPIAALQNLAIAAALLGKGVGLDIWRLKASDASNPERGVCQVVGEALGISNVFFVLDSMVVAKMESAGLLDFDNPSLLAIHASSIPGKQRRSPTARYGRSGDSGGRDVDMAELVSDATDFNDLFERFRLEAVI